MGAGADALVDGTGELVAIGWSVEAWATPQHALVARFREELSRLLEEEASDIDDVVLDQALVLSDRMHEAALEWDLARLLGPDDERGKDAMLRARSAVSRDGRALLRAVSHLADHVSRPRAQLTLIRGGAD